MLVNHLKEIFKEKDISILSFVKETNRTYNNTYRIINSKSVDKMQIKTLVDLASDLGVEIYDIFTLRKYHIYIYFKKNNHILGEKELLSIVDYEEEAKKYIKENFEINKEQYILANIDSVVYIVNQTDYNQNNKIINTDNIIIEEKKIN